MDSERNLLTAAFLESKACLENIFKSSVQPNSAKSIKLSEQVRNKGNELYRQKNHDAETHIEIFRCYCQSILLAPLDSEQLAKAYANRSALLLHIKKYDECITDIDRVLKITQTDELKIKLLCRKVECMKNLALTNYQGELEAAENLATKVTGNNKTQVDRLIDKVKSCSITDRRISRNKITPHQNDIFAQMDQSLDCISIECNSKYGRYLMAKKDYNPGDFIFRDDFYATVLNRPLNDTNCNYCLKICWSGVACDYCSWAMFCSEECKKKAWDEFHNVECSLIPLGPDVSHYFEVIRISLRTLLVGIKEVGSINQLREDLKLVDQSTNNHRRGFYNNDRFTSSTIRSIYSLEKRNFSKVVPKILASDVLAILTYIVDHGKLIKNFKLDKVDDLVTNEDLVFLGSLLIKLTLISMNNIFSFSQMNCDCERLKRADYKCCDRGTGLAALASLLNHSCNPNAASIFTEDRKINIFATQTIKKNTQIFVSYAAFYYNRSLEDRVKALGEYNIRCDCKACVESWPPLFLSSYEELIAKQSVIEKKLHNECKNIFDALDVKQIDFAKKDIKQLCKTIVQADKRLAEPTFTMASFKDALILIYSRIYGWKSPIHIFGGCNDD